MAPAPLFTLKPDGVCPVTYGMSAAAPSGAFRSGTTTYVAPTGSGGWMATAVAPAAKACEAMVMVSRSNVCELGTLTLTQ